MSTLTLPAHSVESEQCVLGALLLDNRAWDRLEGRLSGSDFYRHDHRLIFEAASALLNQSKPADVLTVYDALESAGQAKDTGGLVYLNDLAQNVPSAANVGRYAEIVRQHRIRREVAALGNEIAALAASEGKTDTLVEQVTSMVMSLADTRTAGQEPVQIGDLLTRFVETLERRSERKGGISGLSTGFADLDDKTSGMQPGDLIIIAGRPSMGKTTLAVNIAENVSIAGGVALVVSLEMSADQLTERSVARFGEIDTQRIRKGNLWQNDWAGLTAACGRLEAPKLIIADDPGMANVSRIRLTARKVRQKHGKLDLIVVDYLQLMKGDSANRVEELGAITRALKLLARELGCPLILLSQLNRALESRPDKRPLMADLRESGSIEQDADVVLMCYRDDYYNSESAMKGFAEIIIRKQRMGPLGEVNMVFEGKHSRFLDADPREVMAARNAAPPKLGRPTRRGFDE